MRRQRTYGRWTGAHVRLSFLCNSIASLPTNNTSLYFKSGISRTMISFVFRDERYGPKIEVKRRTIQIEAFGVSSATIWRYIAIDVLTGSLLGVSWSPCLWTLRLRRGSIDWSWALGGVSNRALDFDTDPSPPEYLGHSGSCGKQTHQNTITRAVHVLAFARSVLRRST